MFDGVAKELTEDVQIVPDGYILDMVCSFACDAL